MVTNCQVTLTPPSSISLASILIFSLLFTLLIFSTSPLPAAVPAGPACDLFRGKWVPLPPSASPTTMYSNGSCGTLPSSRNCFLHGRPDDGSLRWRWAPEGGCHLAGFDALGFLELVEGKTAAFVGDSVARNQVDSLLCMLGTVEMPVDVYKDAKDRSRTWHFPRHNFTLMILWTKFLVKHKERGINGYPTGIFDLHLDQLDDTWSAGFQHNRPPIHYAIISDSQWFFRQNYLYENDQVGCETSRFVAIET
ncbi:hypothetical protein V2J09_004571 [Rumex salicifolius]